MNLPLPVVFMLFAFLMPGFFALFTYSRSYQGSVPGDLNWGYGIVLVILFSGIVHFPLLLIACHIRQPDVLSLLYLAGGKVETEYALRIRSSLIGNLGWIGLYSVSSWGLGLLVGSGMGKLASRFVPPRPSDMLLVGEKGVWTVVDVLVEPDLLYRGIYHSHHFPSDKFVGYLSLFLVSRWRGVRTPADTGGFGAVRRTVSGEELLAMIRDDLAASEGLERANKVLEEQLERVKDQSELDAWVDNHLKQAKRVVPQFSVPWPHIRNLNLRQFDTTPRSAADVEPLPAAREVDTTNSATPW